MAPTLNREYVQPGDRVCAAVSGGADSVALLRLLHAANGLPRNALGVGLSAVHVHHGLRGEEANADLAFVEALCAQLDVPLHVERASVPERVALTRESVEEAARNLRYGCFERLIAEGHADSVMTAHTLDDQAETVLMKVIRGAWTEGMSGIHPVVIVECGGDGNLPGAVRGTRRRGRIVRPLLAARRDELRAYLDSLGHAWREDASNADSAFTRNRIRHTILPMLREENPAIDRALANLAELAREDEARWQAELARMLPQLLLPGKPVRGGGRAVSGGSGGSVAIELERLRAMDPALRRRVVRAAARQLGARLNFDETARLLAFAGMQSDAAAGFGMGAGASAKAKPGLQLHAGLRVERSPRELRFYREEETKGGCRPLSQTYARS